MNEIILIGSGGHARSCVDVIEDHGQFKIAGFIISDDNNMQEECLGYPVLGCDSDLGEIRKTYKYALITVGQIKSSKTRIKLYYDLKKFNFKLPTIISSTAYVSKFAKISEGVIIMHHSLVNTNAEIGIGCIINSKSLIEHDVSIGQFCHISTGAIINGDVKIGSKTFIGSRSIIKNSISLGKNCIIGAGTFINKDQKDYSFIKI